MVQFGNLHRVRHHHHHHQKRIRYSSWMIGKVDYVIHLDSGWTLHFQALVCSSSFASFLSSSLGQPLVSSFRCVCHPCFARPNQQLMRTQLFASLYVYHLLLRQSYLGEEYHSRCPRQAMAPRWSGLHISKDKLETKIP
jgi:hypothetical protein